MVTKDDLDIEKIKFEDESSSDEEQNCYEKTVQKVRAECCITLLKVDEERTCVEFTCDKTDDKFFFYETFDKFYKEANFLHDC